MAYGWRKVLAKAQLGVLSTDRIKSKGRPFRAPLCVMPRFPGAIALSGAIYGKNRDTQDGTIVRAPSGVSVAHTWPRSPRLPSCG